MFEDYTYDWLMEEVLGNAPPGIDTRQGSIFYDAVSGPILKIAKLYTDLDLIAELTTVATATGDALDARASEYGVYRHGATSAKYHVTFEGITPPEGARFYTDGVYFVLVFDSERSEFYLEAEIPGVAGNDIYSGTPAVPVNNIENLTAATFGMLYQNGSDPETDDSLRTRVQEKIAGPAENGNKQHYKTWCESIDGIGRARIYPLWNGPNTVKAVLIDTEGKPSSTAKVAEVQEFIDPATESNTVIVNDKAYVVGDGLGEGVANLGAHFTAVAATALIINVTFSAELVTGATKEGAEQEAESVIENYLKTQVLNAIGSAQVVIRVSAIGAILSGLKSMLDYSNLKLNGATENIVSGEDDVPVVGEVRIV